MADISKIKLPDGNTYDVKDTSKSSATNWVNGSATGSVRTITSAEESSSYTIGQQAVAEGATTKASGQGAHAEGTGSVASGMASHAEGSGTTASNEMAHAEGGGTVASGQYSHAEGSSSKATGGVSHAEGGGTTASGSVSHSEGGGTTASGMGSHAENGATTASGDYSHAEGQCTIANHLAQHVFGQYNIEDTSTAAATARGNYVEIVGNGSLPARSNARTLDWSGNEVLAGKLTVGVAGTNSLDVATIGQLNNKSNATNWVNGSRDGSVRTVTSAAEDSSYTIGSYAVTEGYNTKASGYSAHAEGYNSVASGEFSHVEGYSTTASNGKDHAEGYQTTASGGCAHAEGYGTTASGLDSHAEGSETTANNDYAHAEGNNTIASGRASHAEGGETTANGNYAHAEGYSTEAKGYSHAEGGETKATGTYSHAEGYMTTASQGRTHAEGYHTTASDYNAHAEGYYTVASGTSSHAEGYYTVASGQESHAEGDNTIANHFAQHVFGQYNVADDSTAAASSRGNYVEIVGNGTSSTRSNARTLDWSGNEWLAGKLTVGVTGTNSLDVATIGQLPTKTSDLTNDSGFITTDSDEKVKITSTSATNRYYLTFLDTGNTPITKGLNVHVGNLVYKNDGTTTAIEIGSSLFKGAIHLKTATGSAYGVSIEPGSLTSSRVVTFPDKDGTIALTSDIPDVSGFITSETDPVFSASAAAGITATDISNWNNKSDFSGDYIDLINKPTIPTKNIWYATCNTAANVETKIATTTSGDFTLSDGNMVRILMTNGNTSVSAPTISIDGTTAKIIYYIKGSYSNHKWVAGEVIDLVYDEASSRLIMLEGGVASTTDYGVTRLIDSVSSTSTVTAATPNAVKQAYDNGGVQSVNGNTGAVILSIPSKTSDLTNDSGFITGYTETDPVFTASAAHGISTTDITNWNGKQAALVSGTNIKTVNNQSLLGSGNITIEGGASIPYLTCADAASTVAKTTTLVSGTLPPTLEVGQQIVVKFSYYNSASSPTLEVGTYGVIPMTRYGTTTVGTDIKTSWHSGAVCSFTYDGTNWVLHSDFDENTTYSLVKSNTPGVVPAASSTHSVLRRTSTTSVGWGKVTNLMLNTASATPTASYVAEFDSTAHMNSTDMTETEVDDFVDELEAQGTVPVDYIVEQGTDDIWTYRKWNSGIAECWGEYPLAYTSFVAWGSALYYTQPYRSLSFPSGLFIDIPVVNGARVRGVEGWFGVESVNKDTLNNLYMMRPTSVGAGTTNIGIIAKGRWK